MGSPEISGFNFDDTRVKAFNQFNRILRATRSTARRYTAPPLHGDDAELRR